MNETRLRRPSGRETGWRLLLVLLSAALVLLGSDATSPLYATSPYRVQSPAVADATTFIVIGRYWLTEGVLPYRGLFDQKGPMLFLLQGLGWRLTGNVHGICLLQILSVSAFSLLSYRLARKRTAAPAAFGLTAFGLFVLALIYGPGDNVEDFSLPFVALPLLGIESYLQTWYARGQAAHPPRWGLVYGLCIGWAAMTRFTDASTAAAGVLVIGLHLAAKKEWRNLGQNLLAGLLGLALAVLPFAAYFAARGALADFWYGTVGFNLRYATNVVVSWLDQVDKKTAVKLCFYCLPVLLMLLRGLRSLRERRLLEGAFSLLSAGLALGFFLKSWGYYHYLINYVPLLIPAGAALWEGRPEGKTGQKLLRGLLCAAAALTLALNLVQERNFFENESLVWKDREEPPYDRLIAQIPREDYDHVLFHDSAALIYLRWDIRPCCPYFTYQDWQAVVTPGMMDRILDSYRAADIRWLMTDNVPQPRIRQFLDEGFDRVDQSGSFTLYHRRA